MKIPKDLLVLGLVGMELMLLNFVLIRHLVVAFADLETAALVLTLATFAGISLGYLRPERVSQRLVGTALPLFMLLQVALASLGPILVRALNARLGEGPTWIAIFAVVAVGSTSLYSVLLPNAVGDTGTRLRSCYTAEVVGSVLGILLMLALVPLGMTPMLALYLAGILAIAVLIGVRRVTLVAMGLASAAFLAASGPIDRWVYTTAYEMSVTGGRAVTLLWTRHSPYQRVDVIEVAGRGRLLLLDGKVHFAPSMHETYSYFVAEYPARLLGRPSVAVLGCGSMSTVGRIGETATSIRIVDLDERVFEASRKYLTRYNRLDERTNWTFQADDAKHFLATTTGAFDLVVDDVPPARTRQIALLYTREFFELVRARLSVRGIFSLPTLVPVTSTESGYGRRVLATVASVFEKVYVVTVGDTSYAFAGGAALVLDEATMRDAIEHPSREEASILLPDEVRARVAGVPPVTADNLAELIDG